MGWLPSTLTRLLNGSKCLGSAHHLVIAGFDVASGQDFQLLAALHQQTSVWDSHLHQDERAAHASNKVQGPCCVTNIFLPVLSQM